MCINIQSVITYEIYKIFYVHSRKDQPTMTLIIFSNNRSTFHFSKQNYNELFVDMPIMKEFKEK
jgi:hypothetical protein